MYNFHPPLTAFPFALLTSVLIVEGLLFIKRLSTRFSSLVFTRQFLLILAAIFAVAGYLSGNLARSRIGEMAINVEAAMDFHHTIATALLFVIIPCPLLALLMEKVKFGKHYFKLIYLVFLIASFGLTVYTGYLGGQLVFAHAVGVVPLP